MDKQKKKPKKVEKIEQFYKKYQFCSVEKRKKS